MKIGVYGDSYGCINTKWVAPNIVNMDSENLHLGLSWVELLERDGNEIFNYSSPGTAFMFSYEEFLKHHKENDLNIFVVTNPQRIYIKALDGVRMFGVAWVDHEYDRIRKMPFHEKQRDYLEILESARVYLDKWADWEMITHTQHVLVNNLWNLAPNTLVIPGFDDSIEQTKLNLNDLARYELSLVDPVQHAAFNFHMLDCKRKGHFSAENNKVLHNLITRAISQGDKYLKITKDDIVKPANSDFSFYAVMHKM